MDSYVWRRRGLSCISSGPPSFWPGMQLFQSRGPFARFPLDFEDEDEEEQKRLNVARHEQLVSNCSASQFPADWEQILRQRVPIIVFCPNRLSGSLRDSRSQYGSI